MTLTSGRGKKTSSQLSLHPLRFCAGTGTAASGFNQSEKLQVTGRELPLSAGGANVCEVGAESGVEAREEEKARDGGWRMKERVAASLFTQSMVRELGEGPGCPALQTRGRLQRGRQRSVQTRSRQRGEAWALGGCFCMQIWSRGPVIKRSIWSDRRFPKM